MSDGLRSGRFRPADKSFIKKNYLGMTVAEMAKELNRSEKSVYDFIEKELGIPKDSPVLAPGGDRTAENIIGTLRGTPEWEYLKKEFNAAELEMFEQAFGKYVEQFMKEQGVLSTERTQIILAVKLEILMHRLMRSKKLNEELIERAQTKISSYLIRFDDLSKEEKIEIDNLEQKLGLLEKAKDSMNKEYMGYIEKHGDIMKTLKGTRDQRIARIENMKQNFIELIKTLQDTDIAEAEGREMELVRISGDKAYKKVAKAHTYLDGSVDQPILNSDTFENNNEQV